MNNRNQSSGRRDDRSDPPQDRPEPWNVYRLKEVDEADRKERDKPETRFIECGVAWPMKKRDGFTLVIDFQVPEGARLAIMPRTPKGDR